MARRKRKEGKRERRWKKEKKGRRKEGRIILYFPTRSKKERKKAIRLPSNQ